MRNKLTYSLSVWIFFLVIMSHYSAFSQNGVQINPYSQSILLGEQVRVDLNVNVLSDSQNVIWPEFGDTITTQIEVIETLTTDTLYADSTLREKIVGFHKQFVITSFDSGLWEFPELTVWIDSIPFTTETFFFEVNTVKTDTSKAFIDIVEPMNLPLTCMEYFQLYYKYGLMVWAALIVLAIIAFFIGENAIPKSKTKNEPEIPAHIIAIKRLDQLDSEKLWQTGAYKAYHIQISDIIRQYIENRFHIPVLESTTDEIKHLLKQTRIDKVIRQEIIESLRVSDLAKFAKAIPLPEENENCMNTAYNLVNTTKESPKPIRKNE